MRIVFIVSALSMPGRLKGSDRGAKAVKFVEATSLLQSVLLLLVAASLIFLLLLLRDVSHSQTATDTALNLSLTFAVS